MVYNVAYTIKLIKIQGHSGNSEIDQIMIITISVLDVDILTLSHPLVIESLTHDVNKVFSSLFGLPLLPKNRIKFVVGACFS